MSQAKILVVDDEVDLVETVRFPLEMEGFEVLVSYNGVDDYITKPFDIDKLIKKVKNFLKNSWE